MFMGSLSYLGLREKHRVQGVQGDGGERKRGRGSLQAGLFGKSYDFGKVVIPSHHKSVVVSRRRYGVKEFWFVRRMEKLGSHGKRNDSVLFPVDDEDWAFNKPDLFKIIQMRGQKRGKKAK